MNRYAVATAPDTADVLAALLPFLILYGVLILFLIASYVISSIGLYRMAKARGIPAPGLAWVPIGRDWILGSVSGDLRLGRFTLKNTKLWLVLVPVISVAVIFIMYFIVIFGMLFSTMFSAIGSGGFEYMPEGMVVLSVLPWIIFVALVVVAVSIAMNLLFYMAYYQVFSQYKQSSTAVFYLVLSILVPLANSILLFRVSAMPILYPRGQSQS